MFVEIPEDKLRKGLTSVKQFFAEYAATLSYPVKTVGLVEDDEMVGVVVFGRGRLYSITVPEGHRRQGYGGKLYKYALNENGAPDMSVYVPQSKSEATAAFISWGCLFEGFFTPIDSNYKYYRLCGYKNNTPKHPSREQDEQFWEEMEQVADEMLIAHTPAIRVCD